MGVGKLGVGFCVPEVDVHDALRLRIEGRSSHLVLAVVLCSHCCLGRSTAVQGHTRKHSKQPLVIASRSQLKSPRGIAGHSTGRREPVKFSASPSVKRKRQQQRRSRTPLHSATTSHHLLHPIALRPSPTTTTWAPTHQLHAYRPAPRR